jgi:cytochrome c5
MKHVAFALLIAVTAAGCSKQAAAPAAASAAPAPAAAAAATTTAAAENTVGKSLYGKSCALCHAAGVAGAPKPGDKAEWAPRIAQGITVLEKHAIEGFTGQKGQMPPRGGSSASDDEVKAAVRYIVDQSR